MIIETLAAASIAAGAWFLSRKGTETNDSGTDNLQDPIVEDGGEQGDEITVEQEPEIKEEQPAQSEQTDPRKGEVYFGDPTAPYDPFYDYSVGGVHAMSKYQLSSIEGNDETLAQGYRMRIVRPLFVFEDFSSRAWGDKYRNNGMPMQTLEKGGKFLNVLPFYRGGYTKVRFCLEVFNPFDFPAPLQKLRISSVSAAGKECFVIPEEVSNADVPASYPPEMFNPYFANNKLGYRYGSLLCSKNAFAYYASHYLYRFGATDFALNDKEWSNNALPYEPSDHEILTIKNYHVIRNYVNSYDKNQFSGAISVDGKGYTHGNLNPNIKYNTIYDSDSMCKMLGFDKAQAGKAEDFTKRIAVYEGMQHPMNGVTEFVTIPARGSVLLDITLSLAGSVSGRYWKQDHVYHQRNPSNDMIKQMKWNYLTAWQKNLTNITDTLEWHALQHLDGMDKTSLNHIITYTDLGGGYNNRKDNNGGFLFIDTAKVSGISEGDFRLKIAAFSDKNQSVIQDHKGGKDARIGFSSPFFEIGMYRGGRPVGDVSQYEWWKSYWETAELETSGNLGKRFGNAIKTALGINDVEFAERYTDEMIDFN